MAVSRPRQHTPSTSDLMTDGEGPIPSTFQPDLFVPQQNMMFQDNKQNFFNDPNMFAFHQFATGNQHIPFQQLQPRGSSLTPRGTVIRTGPAMHGDERRGYDEIDCVPMKQMGGVCFPPSEPQFGHQGFYKSPSDSVLCKKQMEVGDSDLDRIMPEFDIGDTTMSNDGSKQIKTEDYGIDIFEKEEESETNDTADTMDEDEMTPSELISPKQEKIITTKNEQRECSGKSY